MALVRCSSGIIERLTHKSELCRQRGRMKLVLPPSKLLQLKYNMVVSDFRQHYGMRKNRIQRNNVYLNLRNTKHHLTVQIFSCVVWKS